MTVNVDSIDLTNGSASVPLILSEDGQQYSLVVDIYLHEKHVHPEGHVGWWALNTLAEGQEILLTIQGNLQDTGVLFDGSDAASMWINEELERAGDETLQVHFVLRDRISNAIHFEYSVLCYGSQGALEKAENIRRQTMLMQHEPGSFYPRWFSWGEKQRVHIVAKNMFPLDAIGNFCFELKSILTGSDIDSTLYANNFDPRYAGVIKHICALPQSIKKDDIVFYNYSTYDEKLDLVAGLQCKKIAYYHAITPSTFFQAFDAESAEYLAKGKKNLEELANFDVLAANSINSGEELIEAISHVKNTKKEHNDHEVLDVSSTFDRQKNTHDKKVLVLPPIFKHDHWAEIVEEPIETPDKYLLYVGRMAPHKKIEDLFDFYNTLLEYNDEYSLVIVGFPMVASYTKYLNFQLKNKLKSKAGRVSIIPSVSNNVLKYLYLNSSAFVTLSQHEGFCVPLVEAMYFQKPIFAYKVDAIVETLGCSGISAPVGDYQVLAKEADRVLRNKALRDAIIKTQNKRLKEIHEKCNGLQLWKSLERCLDQ